MQQFPFGRYEDGPFPPKVRVQSKNIRPPENKDWQSGFDDVFANVFKKCTREEYFEIFKDRILTPVSKGFALSAHNYFTKAEWSLYPMFRGHLRKPLCVLATLSSNFRLVVYAKVETPQRNETQDRGESSNFSRNTKDRRLNSSWEIAIDVSSIHNEMMLSEWPDDMLDGSLFDKYKSRLYELSVMDFCWIPCGEEKSNERFLSDMQSKSSATVVTSHANGDLCIWKIKIGINVSTDELAYSSVLEHRRRCCLKPEDFVSCISYEKLTEYVGLLCVGTKCGSLITYPLRVSKSQSNSTDVYEITDPLFLWMEESLSINSVIMKNVAASHKETSLNNDEHIVRIWAHKEPNFIIFGSIRITHTGEQCVESKFNYVKHFAPSFKEMTRFVDNIFLLQHENGALSFFETDGSILKDSNCNLDFENSSNPDVLPDDEGKKAPKWLRSGLSVSPNRAMLCSGREVGASYNHLKFESSGVVEFYSLIQESSVWDVALKFFNSNHFSLKCIMDIFPPLLHWLLKDYRNMNPILTWALPLSDKQGSLKLLNWALKSSPKPKIKDFMYDEVKYELNRAALLRRELLVEDMIVYARCISLLEKLFKSRIEDCNLSKEVLSPIHRMSLTNILIFVRSKNCRPGLDQLSLIEFEPLDSECPLCSQRLKYINQLGDGGTPGKDYQVIHPIDSIILEGYLWNDMYCANHHKVPICILSLVPCIFPYRICQTCHTTCLRNPVFNQKPICPFCSSVMAVISSDTE